jgi:hypothetical protein
LLPQLNLIGYIMTTHESIVEQFETYLKENETFGNGTKAAAARARKALGELGKLTKERRKEIQDEKNAL